MYPVRALAILEGGTFNPGKQMSTMNTIHGGITEVKDQYDMTERVIMIVEMNVPSGSGLYPIGTYTLTI
jgi:hypothetical protein